jgi:hypothetical protein
VGVIDDLYVPARSKRIDAELDEWTGVAPMPRLQITPPAGGAGSTNLEKGIPGGLPAGETPDISMTMTPKGAKPAEPPTGPMGGMLGSNMPNVMADTLANIGRQVAPTLATIGRGALDAMAADVGASEAPKVRRGLTMVDVPAESEADEAGLVSTAGRILDTVFNPPVVQRIVRYLGGTPIATIEQAIRAGGNEKELQDWMRLPEGVRNVIEGSISNVHAMGPGKAPRKPPSIGEAPVAELTLDPQRFQYKVLQGEGGTTGSLSGVQTYDPNLAGIVQVWRDPANGKTYVVNGHNRVALAKAKGIETIPVRYLQVDTAEQAKQVGALTNIAEGRGSSVDAAKLFREGRMTKADLEAKGIPLKEKIATEGISLANLHERLFNEVIQGTMPLERALIIGERVSEPDAQLKLAQLLRGETAKGRRIGNEQVRELADFVESAPTARTVEETLFGSEETVVSLALDKARIAASIRERLSTDKTLFAKVGKEKSAERLTAAGNVINVEESQRLSQQSASLLQIFDHLKNATGEISDILNDAARQLQAGGTFNDIRNDTYQRLTEALPRALSGAEGQSLGGIPGRIRPGQLEASPPGTPTTEAVTTPSGVAAEEPSVILGQASPAQQAKLDAITAAGSSGTWRVIAPEWYEGSYTRQGRTFTASVMDDPDVPGQAIITSLRSEGTGKASLKDVSEEFEQDLRRLGYTGWTYGVEPAGRRGQARTRLFESLRAPPTGTPEAAAIREAAFQSPGRFNPAHQLAPEDITDLTAALNVRAREAGIMAEQTRGRQAWTETERQANALVQSGEMSVERIVAMKPGEILNAEEGRAARNIRDSAATTFKELLARADAGDEAAKAGLEPAGILASRIETNVEAATGTEVARALAIRRKASMAYEADDIYQRMMVRSIDPNVLHEFFQHFATNIEKEAFTKYFETTSKTGRWVDAFLEARAGGLLSHRSFIRNLGGSAATTVWSIPERFVTAVIGGPSQGAYSYEAVEMAYGMYEAQKTALLMAGKAARTGESQFLPLSTQTERPMLHAMSSEALGVSGPMGRAIDVYGEIARVQFRGLVAGDDYFKYINYVGQTRALAYRRYRQLLAEGTPRPDAAREYEALIANPPTWLREQAEAHALYTTFNDDIVNPLGKLVMAAREDAGPTGKIMRLILPFAKTPMNVMGYGAERTPGLNFLSAHFWQEMRSGDTIRQDAAAARLALGSSVYLVLAVLAGEGYIMGKGPRDPKLAQQYRENGQLPYSVKLPNFPAIPFRGAEPLSQIMAQAADFAELVDQGAALPDLAQMAAASVLSSLDYMEDQPMLKSIAQVVDAWRQNDARANEGLMQLFTSFLPVPGFQSAARLAIEQTDPLMRETRTPHGGRTWLGRQVVDLGQEIATRTPGLSNDLYPQRDILGRPMLRQGGWWTLSPNAPAAQEPHPVMDEINRQQITVGKVPKALGPGKQTMTFVGYDPDRMALELSAKEWDRFQELAGTVELDGKTLDQALRELIASDLYQEGSDTARGTKATMIRGVFQEYRQEARDQLVSEGPKNAAGQTRLEEELEKKASVKEFQQMDKAEQEEARPELEQSLGRPTRIGILR